MAAPAPIQVMSCIRFNTPAQQRQLARLARENAPAMEKPVAQFLGPEFGESKIRRLRILAGSPVAKIREAAAASYHAPADVMESLARDADEGVRTAVARNETTSCDVLRELAHDPSERVRGFVAVNYWAPADAMAGLAGDESPQVRALVSWKTQLRDEVAAAA